MSDLLGPILIIGLIVGLISWAVWYDNRYPCIKYQAVHVAEWVEFQTLHIDQNTTMIIPVTHPAHWEQRCMQRGDARLGDIPAAYAQIPAERE